MAALTALRANDMKHYKLTDETMTLADGTILHRIECTEPIERLGIRVGAKGGWIEKESNLNDEAWVYGDAEVYGDADVHGNAEVYGDADVYGNAKVYGDAVILSNRDYIVFKNWWSSGRYFTWTRSNNMWRVGCFYGTGEELIAKAYKDSEKSGREYERVVKYVQSILDDELKQ